MTDRFNLSFTNEEHELYLWLQSQKNPSGLIKDLLRAYRNGEQTAAPKADAQPANDPVLIKALMQTFVGEDIEGYGGERAFLQYVDRQMLNNRVSLLMAAHPVEAAAVITATKERYPAVGVLL